MQTQFPLISSMQRPPKPAPDKVLRQVSSEAQAVDISIRMCGKAAFVASSMGCTESYISRIRTGQRPIPEARREAWIDAFCHVTGTLLLRQFVRMEEALHEPTPAHINARLAQIMRGAA